MNLEALLAKIPHERRSLDGSVIVWLRGDHLEDVVGESYYQEGIDLVVGGKTPSGHHGVVAAWLGPEPTNKYDPSAVKVMLKGEQKKEYVKAGYLPRELATLWHPVITIFEGLCHAPVLCAAVITGGWKRPKQGRKKETEGHYGVQVALSDLREILSRGE